MIKRKSNIYRIQRREWKTHGGWKRFCKIYFEYSESGIVILEEEYGKDGNLKLDPADGIARSTTEIQTQGDTTFKTTKFFGTNGELKINEVLEVAIVKTTTKQSAEGKEIKPNILIQRVNQNLAVNCMPV